MKILSYFACLWWLLLCQSLPAAETENTDFEDYSPGVDGEQKSPNPKRTRHLNSPPVKTACDYCRKRHLKCSETKPCNNCEHRGIQCEGFVNGHRFHTISMDSKHFTETRSPPKNQRKRKKPVNNEESQDDVDAQHQYVAPALLHAEVVCPKCKHHFSPGVDPYPNNQPARIPYPVQNPYLMTQNPTDYPQHQHFMDSNTANYQPQAPSDYVQYNSNVMFQCTMSVGMNFAAQNFTPNPYLPNSLSATLQRPNDSYPDPNDDDFVR